MKLEHGSTRTLALVLAAGLLHTACVPAGGTLELDPGTVSACDTPLAVTVRWKVPEPGQQVALYVSSPGHRLKQWITVAGDGEQKTGRWAGDGMTITMKSPDGKILARRTLTTTYCAKEK